MSDRPNILIIHADQHRCDALGAYGNADIQTPHIDALAADGVRHDAHFCSFPVCTPSRYSLVSGLYVHQHLGWTNHCTLPAGVPTFPRALRDAGYRTRAVGKMHFTPTYLDVGFEAMELAEQNGPGRCDDDYHRYLQAEGLCDRIDLIDQEAEYREGAPDEYWQTLGALASDLDEEHHSTTWIGDRAAAIVDRWEGGGNLLMAGFIKPHHPFDPPAPWHRMYDPEALALVPGWTAQCLERDLACSPGYFPNARMTEPQLRRAMAYYYATISQIDHQVGRLVELLKERGLYDNTLIVYTSDHGEFLGFHHLLLKGNHMYDPLVRIPLIVKYPGQERAGQVCDALSGNVDVAPSLLRQAGCPVPATMTGADLAAGSEGADAVFAEAGRGGQYMVRTRTRKLLLGPTRDSSLFLDLEADPCEMDDLFDEPVRQAEIGALREQLVSWLLFTHPPVTHLDEWGPVCGGENTVRYGDSGRAAREAYFRRRMGEIEGPLEV